MSTFVGKSNLVKGNWVTKDSFVPAGFPFVSWPDIGISEELKEQNLYAIRPEQWIVDEPQQGELKGKVLFAQFQGNEIHYSILVDDRGLNVYSSVFNKRFIPGDTVCLKINAGVKNSVLSS